MRRILVVLIVLATIFSLPVKNVLADDGPQIVFVITAEHAAMQGLAGESCSVELPGARIPRVIVRDEKDEIVAIDRFRTTVNGQWSDTTLGESGMNCSLGEHRMDLPDARYYQVFVDSELYAIWGKDELPNNDDKIAITFDLRCC